MSNSIDIPAEQFTVFKGNQFTSFHGILMWGVIGIFTLLALVNIPYLSLAGVGVLLAFFAFMFGLHSWMMHYFMVSDDYLVVKNPNFPWVNKVFALQDIEEVKFTQDNKSANCLRVLTNDGKHKLYPAGTLRRRHWLALKDTLEANGVKVVNTCIREPKQ